MFYEPTCEVCGSYIEDDVCKVCEHTGYNGDWIEKVIEEDEATKDRK
jgi:RNA polymerase subunit RPABC4/transcription elongation factor Spt4